MFKLELKRAFSIKFYICLLIGLIIACLDMYDRLPYKIMNLQYINSRIAEGILVYEQPSTAYTLWMGTNMSAMHTLFMRIMPILIVIPYGASLCFDKKGYNIQFLSRVNKRKYYFTKYIVQFLNSGAIAVLPLIGSLIAAGVLFPFSRPMSYTAYYPIFDFTFLSGLFYSQYHLLYIVVYLLVNFVGYGLLGVLSCVAALWEKNKYICMIIPMLCAYIVHSISVFVEPLRNCSMFYYPSLFNVSYDGAVYILAAWAVSIIIILAALAIEFRRDS
ncbi:MAG: hypothetical protein ACI4GD_01430 [Lachnospiraceae bacterium]